MVQFNGVGSIRFGIHVYAELPVKQVGHRDHRCDGYTYKFGWHVRERKLAVNLRIHSVRSSWIVAIAVAIALGSLCGWTQAPAATGGEDQPKGLLITILEGEGALNDIRARTAREPIVEVDDENHKPVAGALVLFSLDNGGGSPFATFAGSPTVSVETDAAGRAVGKGFQATQRKGNFQIKVHVSKGQLQADAVIAETNVTALDSAGSTGKRVGLLSSKKLYWILGGAAAGGAAAGIVLAMQQSRTTITPGTGTVGAPAAIGGIRIQLHGHHP
jgi:hypothetical protein